ncbi:MAG: DUF58 domain-containing protein [Janthinobacterium lividum]
MATLAPTPVTATAQAPAAGRLARLLGPLPAFAFTPRMLGLLAGGVLLATPAFFRPRSLWVMVIWDVVLLLLAVYDATQLPSPASFEVEREFGDAPALGRETTAVVRVLQTGPHLLRVGVQDGLHPALAVTPATQFVTVFPGDSRPVVVAVVPAKRGRLLLDGVYLRYRTLLGLAERRAVVPLQQTVLVSPSGLLREETALALLRARQSELDRRRLRRIGIGREFESLRDYQAGDERRNLSSTATARRGRPITRTFSVERSQQVWIVVDAGRLSRTSFYLPRSQAERSAAHAGHPATEQVHDERIHVQQLDQAAATALLLAQVVDRAGDRSALLAYGRGIQQQIKPSRGPAHLRAVQKALSLVTTEHAEADHRRAAAHLRTLQGRRSVIVWITEMGESAHQPDVALAIADLARMHLVVLILLKHPELEARARRLPHDAGEMFSSAAAEEMLARLGAVVRRLRNRGVLVVETAPANAPVATINQYLEVKARGTL